MRLKTSFFVPRRKYQGFFFRFGQCADFFFLSSISRKSTGYGFFFSSWKVQGGGFCSFFLLLGGKLLRVFCWGRSKRVFLSWKSTGRGGFVGEVKGFVFFFFFSTRRKSTEERVLCWGRSNGFWFFFLWEKVLVCGKGNSFVLCILC